MIWPPRSPLLALLRLFKRLFKRLVVGVCVELGSAEIGGVSEGLGHGRPDDELAVT